MANVINNLFLLEEQDKAIFESQRLSQGNKTISYTTKNSDGVSYLGIEGTDNTTVSVNVYITKEPRVMNSYNTIMTPYIETIFDFFDNTWLTIGKVFIYDNNEYTVISRIQNITNRITISGRAAVQA